MLLRKTSEVDAQLPRCSTTARLVVGLLESKSVDILEPLIRCASGSGRCGTYGSVRNSSHDRMAASGRLTISEYRIRHMTRALRSRLPCAANIRK